MKKWLFGNGSTPELSMPHIMDHLPSSSRSPSTSCSPVPSPTFTAPVYTQSRSERHKPAASTPTSNVTKKAPTSFATPKN